MTTFEALELAWVDARTTFGEWYLAETLGGPVDGRPGTTADRAAAYRVARGRLDTAVRDVDAAGLPPDEARGLASIRSSLGYFDDIGGPAGHGPGGGPLDGDRTHDAAASAAESPEITDLRRATLAAYGEAATDCRCRGQQIDRLTAFAREASELDPSERRATFLSQAGMWQAVDGDGGPDSPYRRLLRSSAERWRIEGSPIDRAAVAVGLTPDAFEAGLRRALETWRDATDLGDLEPWDFRHATGAASRRLDPLLGVARLREINDRHLAGLGADPSRLGIRYDIEPRQSRPAVPVAFSMPIDLGLTLSDGTWKPATPWVVATYAEGGYGNLVELLHESGHALHYAAIRARPSLFEPMTEDGGLVEGIADIVGWDAHEPAFLRCHLGRDVPLRDLLLERHASVVLDLCWALFEVELHREPDRRPNDVWTDLTSRYLRVVPHPEWSWWAVRGQLVELPGYMANYGISAIVAAAVRDRMRARRGDWLGAGGDPGWYADLSDGLLRFGASIPADEAIRGFLGRDLTVEPLIADIARTGAA